MTNYNIDTSWLTSSALTMAAMSQADKNCNGKIDDNESDIFTKALKELGDSNGDGVITNEEATAYAKTLKRDESEENVQAKQRYQELSKKYDLNKLEDLPKPVLNEFIEICEKMNSLNGLSFAQKASSFIKKQKGLAEYLNKVVDNGVIPVINGSTEIFKNFINGISN